MQISKSYFTICTVILVSCAPSSRAADSEEQAKAREALRQRMSELDAEQAGRGASKSQAPATQAPATQAPATTAPGAVNPPPSTVDDEATARAREALRQKIRELNAQAPRGTFQSNPEYSPIPTGPSPVPGSKEARLADLLQQYKTDQITAEQYHKERAKILAEP